MKPFSQNNQIVQTLSRDNAEDLEMFQASFWIVQEKIWLIEINICSYGPVVVHPEQSETVRVLLWTCGSLFVN